MSNFQNFLEHSRDSWQESAKYDRKQFLASLAIASTGIILAGVGVGTMLHGDITGGSVELIAGTGITIPYMKLGLEEMQDYADSTAHVAVLQNQIDELAES